MEENLDSNLSEIMKDSSVSSVICTDLQGLILSSKGDSHSSIAGSMSALAAEAFLLCPDELGSPVITLEGEQSLFPQQSNYDQITAEISDGNYKEQKIKTQVK